LYLKRSLNFSTAAIADLAILCRLLHAAQARAFEKT
jgi:hypothetical protein